MLGNVLLILDRLDHVLLNTNYIFLILLNLNHVFSMFVGSKIFTYILSFRECSPNF